MYCKKCGKNIADDSVFCAHCGIGIDSNVTNGTSNGHHTDILPSLDYNNDNDNNKNSEKVSASSISFSLTKIQLGTVALEIPHRLFVQKDKAWWVWPLMWAVLFLCYNNGVSCYRNGNKFMTGVYFVVAIVVFVVAAGIMQVIKTGHGPF